MKKYTGNYSNTEHNFVIQNLPKPEQISEFYLQIISVLRNIILRGSPTILSKNLQSEFGIENYYKNKEFKNKIPLISQENQDWYSTIGGDVHNQYFPAKEFFNAIPVLFPKFKFIQNLIRPETPINDIIEEGSEDFIEQRVDFYLEAAKLIIEIDGGQHILNATLDRRRNQLFEANNILTVRISTNDLRSKSVALAQAILTIQNRLDHFGDSLNFYSKSNYTDKEINYKLRLTAVLRWQVLLLSLLENGTISFADEAWNINIVSSDIQNFAIPASNDLLNWLFNLFLLNNKPFTKPTIKITENKSYHKEFINIDFSLLKRWTDANELNPNIIYVRTDYHQSKNYFEVSGCNPIKYELIEEEHKEILEFFLQSIFNKPNFRDGQLSIICNALNRNDTIGLLPTGAGKSICYQLSSILQPSVSIVVSPLKSLMFDQKENLDSAFFSNTNYISSDQNAQVRAKVQKQFAEGKYLFVWISPERLQIKTFREYLSTVNNKYRIVYAVIDEVHCLSEWGHDFRTSYLNLAKTINHFCPDAKYLGLTATASSRVHRDIKAEFNITETNIKSLNSFDREELSFIVKSCKSNEKLDFTKRIIREFQNETNFIDDHGEEGKAAIIFSPHVGWNFGCYTIYKQLNNIYPDKVNYFSGSIPRDGGNPIMNEAEFDAYRLNVQREFRENKYPLLAATKSFGMGIDKPNINLTIHFGISPSIESTYQEAGRAGRHPDKTKKAKSKCYILFSDEVNEEIKEVIENPETTFNQLFEIQERFKYNGDDLFRQLYFYTESFTGQENELNEIIDFTHNYFRSNQTKVIQYNSIRDKTKKEKCIYRLSLLNVVTDYTIDFAGHTFDVVFKNKTDESVFHGLYNYISKYEPKSEDELLIDVNKLSDTNLTARCLRYLIYWIYDNIAYERRQALKGIADLCREYKNSEDFKRQIVAYFEVNEITFLLQHISEHPYDFEKWFDVFVQRNQKFEIFGYILKDKNETENVKLKLQRFLESYKNNVGLNFISGIIRLFLEEFEDKDGGTRFEQALVSIQENFSQEVQEKIIDKTLEIGVLLDTIGRFSLSYSVLKFFPLFSQRFYNVLGDTNSLDFILQVQTKRLKRINSELYGELSGIE